MKPDDIILCVFTSETSQKGQVHATDQACHVGTKSKQPGCYFTCVVKMEKYEPWWRLNSTDACKSIDTETHMFWLKLCYKHIFFWISLHTQNACIYGCLL